MDRIRKIAALLLALCLALGLVACGAVPVPEDTSRQETPPEEALVLIQEEEAPGAQETQEASEAPETAEAPEEENVPESTPEPAPEPTAAPEEETPAIDPEGEYTSKEDVALYLHTYGELPQNFMTKNEARNLGWSGGGLDDYAYGMCIGGDRFGNYEGILPPGNYRECDIDTLHARSRGAKRLIYADDGRIYYTDDHYESFTLLYGEE